MNQPSDSDGVGWVGVVENGVGILAYIVYSKENLERDDSACIVHS